MATNDVEMIYFLVPVYNEAANLPSLIGSLAQHCTGMDHHFVFVDDGSTDDSVVVLRSLLDANGTVLSMEKNKGPGAAFNAGFEHILSVSENDEDIIISIEADNTSDPNLIKEMIQLNKMGYDLILASVYAQGGGFDSTSFFRRLVSSIANLMMRFTLDLRVQTLSSFYRCYSVASIRKVHCAYPRIIEENGFICMVELLLKCVRQKCRVVEVPMVLHSKNRKGRSKMKVFRTTREYLRFMITFKSKLRSK